LYHPIDLFTSKDNGNKNNVKVVVIAVGVALGTGLLWSITKVCRPSPRDRVPHKMKTLKLTNHIELGDDNKECFNVEEVETPVPGYNRVLIRVERSPINPSDLAYMQGSYGVRQNLPYGVGNEGSGVVVQRGAGLMSWLVEGKRVAFTTEKPGAWSQYVDVPANRVLPLPDQVSFEHGCSAFVNPLTALAMIDIAKRRCIKTILHTAAASALGKMLVRLCDRHRLKLIAVVRKAEQRDQLLALQTDSSKLRVLLSTSDDFESVLQSACAEDDCRLAFDAVGGALTGTLFRAMPPGSEVQVYGGLDHDNCSGLSPLDLIFKNKSVSGLYLPNFLQTRGIIWVLRAQRAVKRHLLSDLRTEVRTTFPLEQASDAIAEYITNMTAGKVCIDPQA